jgi:hypothetical protein
MSLFSIGYEFKKVCKNWGAGCIMRWAVTLPCAALPLSLTLNWFPLIATDMLNADKKILDTPSDTQDENPGINQLLARLQHASSEKEEAAIWSDMWGALAHTFRKDSTLYTVVPFIATLAAGKALDGRLEYLHFVGVVEALRHQKHAPPLPAEIRDDYFSALKSTEDLIIECLRIDWDESGYRSLLGSLASVRAGIEFKESHHGNIWW